MSISSDGNILSTRGSIVGSVGDLNYWYDMPKSMLTTQEGIERGRKHLWRCLDYFVKVLGRNAIRAIHCLSKAMLEASYSAIILTTYRRMVYKSLWI